LRADVADVETPQEAPQRRRLRQTVAAQPLLRPIGAQRPRVVQTVAAGDQRLDDRHHRLGGRKAAPAARDRQPVEQPMHPKPDAS
jgi:hypothetical protein